MVATEPGAPNTSRTTCFGLNGTMLFSAPLGVDEAKRRFLAALAYYAALGVERVDLVAEAERVEALRQADRLRDVLLASLSHDLRTPLTTIKAVAQQAASLGDGAAAVIEEQADLLSRLVGDLLDWSRLKAGAFPVNPELNTAEDLVGAVARQCAGLSGDGRLTTSVDLERPVLAGSFDFLQSLRILSNLVENGLRHTPPGTSVELSVRRNENLLEFEVADRGPGVAPEERDRIFEPFYRPSSSQPDVGRAGLGLSIARRLAEVQGGSLECLPREGGGSCFRLRLPAAELRDLPEESL